MSLGVGLLVLAGCVAAQAFFSGSERALVHADRGVLRERAEAGDRGAELALELLRDEPSMLATCLVGAQLCLVTGAVTTANLLLASGHAEVWATTLVWAPVVLVAGEALPKTVMQHHADVVAPSVAGALTLCRTIFRPFLVVVRAWSALVTRATGGRVSQGDLTRQELLELLEPGRNSPIDPEERRLIRGVLSLQDLTAGDCMTPLVRVVAVAQDATVGVASDIAVRTQHSRIPVYDGRIDHIVGVVHQADLLFVPEDTAPLAPHVRRVPFVPDAKSADALFAEMRSGGEHFAVVVDEYGGCVGVVTLEDLLEQFVGDIHDERDVVRPTLLELEDGSWSVPGHAEVDEVAARAGVPLPEGDYETVAGLVLHRLGRIPAAGDTLELPGVRLRVEESTDRAIKRVRLVPMPPAADIGRPG